MRKSPQRREACSEALGFFSGGGGPRLLLEFGAGAIVRGAAIGGAAYGPGVPRANMELLGALAGLVVAVGGVSVGMGLWAIRKVSDILLARVRRPAYYPAERLRRVRQAAGRRRARERLTTGACPKPAELLAQYAKAREGAREALLFGSMLCDLEAYCDNSLVRDEWGEIRGRNPGVKGWLRDNCAGLLPHYKNAMRYKRLAEKFRRACGAADPVPAAALLAEGAARLPGGGEPRRVTARNRKSNGPRRGRVASGTFALDAGALAAAAARAREILAECEGGTRVRPRSGMDAGGRADGDHGGGDDNRPRRGMGCGKDVAGERSGREGRRGVKSIARPRRGMIGGKGAGREGIGDECRGREGQGGEGSGSRGRGGATRLAAILDKMLAGGPDKESAPTTWRAGGWPARVG